MLRKIHRQIERKREGRVPLKFRFDVQIVVVKNLPPAVNMCRVVWARGPKIQMTRAEVPVGGTVQYDQLLTQVATIYRANTFFENKEYSFAIQAPSKKPSTDKMVTLGQTSINLAEYTSLEPTKFEVDVPVEFHVGSQRVTVTISTVIASALLKGLSPADTLTEISALSGFAFTPATEVNEQDLAGFYTETSSMGSYNIKSIDTIEKLGGIVPESHAGFEPAGQGDIYYDSRSPRARGLRMIQVEDVRGADGKSALEKLQEDYAQQKKIWEREKAKLVELRLNLEEELTKTKASEDELKEEIGSLKSKLSEVTKGAEKQKSRHSKELLKIKQLWLDGLQDAETKIRDIELCLEKEREDHQQQVKILEEDARQLSHQLVYEKQNMEDERRNFLMAEQHWTQLKHALELEMSDLRSRYTEFDSDSQIEFLVNSIQGSLDHGDKTQMQPLLSLTDRSLSVSPTNPPSPSSLPRRSPSVQSLPPRPLSPQMSIASVSKLESENAELKFRISDYKVQVQGLHSQLHMSLKSVDEAHLSCDEAVQKIHAVSAERDHLKVQLECTLQKLNNLEHGHGNAFHGFGNAQGNIEELEVKKRHLEQVVQELEGDIEKLRLEAASACCAKETLKCDLEECRNVNVELESRLESISHDKTQLVIRLEDAETRVASAEQLASDHLEDLEEARTVLKEKSQVLNTTMDKLNESETAIKNSEQILKVAEERLAGKERDLWEYEEILATRTSEIKDLEQSKTDMARVLEEQLFDVRAERDKEVGRLMAEKQSIQARKSKLESRVVVIQKELDELGKSLDGEFEGMKQKLAESEAACRELTLERDSLQGLINAKDHMVSLLEAEAANLRNSIEDVYKDLKSKESDLEISDLNISVLEGKLKASMAAEQHNGEAFTHLQARAEELEKEATCLKEEKQALILVVEELNGKIQDSDNTCSKLSQDLAESQSLKGLQLEKINEMEAEMTSLIEEYAGKQNLEDELSVAQEQVKKMEKEVAVLQEANPEILSLRKVVANAESTCKESEQTIVRLKEHISDLEEECKSWNTRWDAQVEHVSRVPELESLVGSLQKANQGLERSISRKKKDIESLQSELNDLKVQLQDSGQHMRPNSGKENHRGLGDHSSKAGFGGQVLEFEMVSPDGQLLEMTSSREELDMEKATLEQSLEQELLLRKEIEDKLESAKERAAELEAQLAHHTAELEVRKKSGCHVKGESVGEMGSVDSTKGHENEQIMQELVETKVAMAELQEKDIMTRRELYKSMEYNMKLASKMTKLEALLYSREEKAKS